MTVTATAAGPAFADGLNLADHFLFDRLREGKGDKVAIRFGDRAWTYAEVADRARALASALVARGLRPEQRVYIVLPDVPPFAWGIFATLAAGGILTMGNPAAPPDDLAYVLDYVKAGPPTSDLWRQTSVAPSPFLGAGGRTSEVLGSWMLGLGC